MTSTHEDRIRAGLLHCTNGHRYPVHDFLPVFTSGDRYMEIFSRLRDEPAAALPSRGELDVEKITREEFAAQTQLAPEDLRGKTVLDAGCGGGRFTQLLASHGVQVVGMDMDAVGLGQVSKTLAAQRHAHFAQADLFRLPFRSGVFDFIFSLGVLHHTPDPKAAFFNLARLLKPGGRIAIWVYPKYPRTLISDLLRPVTTRIPSRHLYRIAWGVTATYGPVLRLPRVKGRVQAILYRTRLPWHEDHHWRIHSFLDWYGPKYQYKYSPDEVETWFAEAGLVDVIRGLHASSARGTAPS